MRTRVVSGGISLLVCLALTGFFIFDEEPLVDFTDLNVLHVLLVVIGGLAVVADLSLRGRAGHYTTKDWTCLFTATLFWVHLENYLRLIFVVLGFHALAPLELDLLELVELHAGLAAWLVVEILPACLCVGLAYAIGLQLFALLGSGRALARAALLLLLVCVLFLALFLLAWDLCFAGLSSLSDVMEVAPFYAQPKTSLTYDQGRAVRDQFEWHRAQANPAVLRFEDLYLWLLQLSFAFAVLCAGLVWLSLLLDVGASLGARPLTSAQVAAAMLWLGHASFAGWTLVLFGPGVAAVRVLARTGWDLGLLWG